MSRLAASSLDDVEGAEVQRMCVAGMSVFFFSRESKLLFKTSERDGFVLWVWSWTFSVYSRLWDGCQGAQLSKDCKCWPLKVIFFRSLTGHDSCLC